MSEIEKLKQQLNEIRTQNRYKNYENQLIEIQIKKVEHQIAQFADSHIEEKDRIAYAVKVENGRIETQQVENEQERKAQKLALLRTVRKTKEENTKLEIEIMKLNSEYNRIMKILE